MLSYAYPMAHTAPPALPAPPPPPPAPPIEPLPLPSSDAARRARAKLHAKRRAENGQAPGRPAAEASSNSATCADAQARARAAEAAAAALLAEEEAEAQARSSSCSKVRGGPRAAERADGTGEGGISPLTNLSRSSRPQRSRSASSRQRPPRLGRRPPLPPPSQSRSCRPPWTPQPSQSWSLRRAPPRCSRSRGPRVGWMSKGPRRSWRRSRPLSPAGSRSRGTCQSRPGSSSSSGSSSSRASCRGTSGRRRSQGPGRSGWAAGQPCLFRPVRPVLAWAGPRRARNPPARLAA